MNRDELVALQAPLKERYREEPDAARITLRASGRLGEGVTCSIETGRAVMNAGLHPATGGDGSGFAQVTCCSTHWRRARE